MTTRQLFAALFVVALFTMAVRETLDPDMWWHLRTGQLILEAGIPRYDTFSFTVPDHEWITHEWLSQVFMWGLYRIGGLPGLIVGFALLIALAFWLVYLTSAGRPFLAAFVLLLAALASAIVWGVRPQIFNLLLTAAFVHVVERYKTKRVSWRALWLLPLLTILWANLHSGYLLGIVLLGTYTVGEALQRWFSPHDQRTLAWTAVRSLAFITAASFLAAVVNPNGPELWIYPFFTLGSQAMQTNILEWQSPDFHLSYFWPFAAMLFLGIVSWLFSRERPLWSELLLFLGTAAAGLLSARHIPLFAVVSAPIVARHLLSAFTGSRAYPLLSGRAPEVTLTRTFAALNWAIFLLALVASGMWTARKISGNEEAIRKTYPVAAVDFLEEEGLTQARGYNTYNWGGYLIWRGVPVFVDGRADVYGDDFLFYYLQTYRLEATWAQPLNDFDVDYVLMEPTSPLSTLLATSPQWREIYRDDIAQVFVRNEVELQD
jgi:hypothetical protein